jgi:hypothetical protein
MMNSSFDLVATMRYKSHAENARLFPMGSLLNFQNYQNIMPFRKEELVTEPLHNADRRQAWWSESIAVGDESFIETIKQRLGLHTPPDTE